MTNKETIEYLKEAQSHIDLEMGGNTQKVYDAIELAIELVREKQNEMELAEQGINLMWMNDEHLKLLKEFEARPTGEWEKHYFRNNGVLVDFDWDYKCTNCQAMYGNQYKFCPNCGAKMKEAENG